MTPYYSEDGITLYHGDCREILPTFPDKSFDLVLTDPPYGLGFRAEEWDKSIPDWLGGAQRVASIVAFTTAPTTLWDYPRPDWVAMWYRPAAQSRTAQGGFNHWSPIPIYGKRKMRVDSNNLHAMQNATYVDHPSPKPIKLFRWLVEELCEEGPILDPFCGSGTTLVAAKQLGRKAVGIEIEEKYCEIAVKRLAQMELFNH